MSELVGGRDRQRSRGISRLNAARRGSTGRTPGSVNGSSSRTSYSMRSPTSTAMKLPRDESPTRYGVGNDIDRHLRSRARSSPRSLIGYTGDVRRFSDRWSLRRLQRHRPDRVLLRRSDRASTVTAREPTLNHAIHMVAVTQIRHRESDGRALLRHARSPPARPDAKRLRALKRQLCDRVYRHLTPPTLEALGPGGQPGNDSHIQRGRPNPEPGTSDQSLPDPKPTLAPTGRTVTGRPTRARTATK